MGKTWGTAAEVSGTHEMRSFPSHLFIPSVFSYRVASAAILYPEKNGHGQGGRGRYLPFMAQVLARVVGIRHVFLSHVRCEKIWSEVVRVKRRNRRR